MPVNSLRFPQFATLLACAALASPTRAQAPQAAPLAPAITQLSDDQIRDILIQRIDKEHRAIGIVVGLVSEKGTRIISYGKAITDAPAAPGFEGDASALARPLDGDTLFEIGSITKTFTANILADMARRGEVSLEDPVAKYLPENVEVPRKGDKDITLRLLAQHMSGLPRMPDNFKPANPANPYADYNATLLYQWLSNVTPPREPGEDREYSNVGYGLLGHALTLKAGTTYEALLKDRITGPLGMTDTIVALSPDQQSRLAHGHGEDLAPVANWDLDALAGAGAIRSTVKDMLKYCAANLGLLDTPLAPTFADAQALRYPWRKGEKTLGSLAWAAPTPLPNDRKLWWHNGGTGGYHSFLGFDRENRVGVVVLSNAAGDIDDIAVHIIEPAAPLAIMRTAISLPREALDRCVGVYEVGPGSYRNITRYRDRLIIQRTGQPRFELKPESPLVFFNNEIRATVTFIADASSGVTGLVLKSGAMESPAKRVDRPFEGKPPFEQDPATFDTLEGTYAESPTFALTVRRDADRLFVSATGQPEIELIPIAMDHFACLGVDAELAFERGPDNRAISATRYQGGIVASSRRTN